MLRALRFIRNDADLTRNDQVSVEPAPKFELSLDEVMRGPVRLGLVVSFAFLLGFCTWAGVAPLSSSVVAGGQITIGDNGKQLVQTVESGQIKEILVKDGDIVSEGQVLVKMDDVDALASLQIIKGALFSLEVTAQRLRDELDKKEIFTVPQYIVDFSEQSRELRDVIANQKRLFGLRLLAHKSKRNLLEQNRITISKEISGLSTQMTIDQKRLESTEKELTGLRDLVSKGYATRARLIDGESRQSDIVKAITSYDTAISKLREELISVDLKLLNLEYETAQEIERELIAVQDRIIELTEKSKVAERNLARLTMLSPISGAVNNMRLATTGNVLRPGDVLMEIVPPNEELVIEAHLPRDHISSLIWNGNVNDYGKDGKFIQAKVRLPAYAGRWRRQLNAEVVYVSADIESTNQSRIGTYLIRARISPEDIKEFSDIKLYPGMAAEVYVVTGSRTMFSYLFEPVVSVLRHSMSS